jgi:hypothetical protein
MSAPKFNAIKYQTSIQSFAGSPQLLFTATVTNYINIATILSGSTVFVDNFNTYTFFKIVGVKIEIQRSIPEAGTAIVGVFASGVLPPLFALFAPSYTSTGALSPLPQCSAAIEFDPFVSERQKGSWNYPPILAYNNATTSIGSIHHYGMWNTLTSNYTNMPGSIQISPPTGGANALTSTNLFMVTITVDVEFACDYA